MSRFFRHSVQFENETAWHNYLGLATDFPVPTFPRLCVCCNSDEGITIVSSPVQGGRGKASDVGIPCCDQCRKHALVGRLDLVYCVAIIFIALGAWLSTKEMLGWGIALMAAGAALIFLGLRCVFINPERRFGTGHFGPVQLNAAPGRFRVKSYNEKLIDALKDLNPDLYPK